MAGLIDEIFIALGFKVDDKPLKETDKNVKSTLKGLKNMALAAATAVIALDRMANSLAKINQQYINFNRQTGLSVQRLNQIAGAAMMADYNFTPEQAMQGLQSLESNLAQIRLGQGNIAPFQILGISPVGKDATQIIEDLREAIKGVDDMTAVNLIQQMGLSPEFISMLRMTREEMQEFSSQANQYMLTDEQRAQLHKYSMELKLVHLEMANLKNKAIIAILPHLNNFLKGFNAILTVVEKVAFKIKSLIEYVGQFKGGLLALGISGLGIISKLNTAIKIFGVTVNLAFGKWFAILTAVYLILEDLAVWALGGKSLLKLGFEKMSEIFNPNSKGEEHTDTAFEKDFGQKRNAFRKYADWIAQGGFLGTITGGATRTQQTYDFIDRMGVGKAPSTSNSNTTINQTNNLSFKEAAPSTIADTTTDLMYAQMQANLVI